MSLSKCLLGSYQLPKSLSNYSLPSKETITKLAQLRPEERNQERLNSLLFACALLDDTASSKLLVALGADPTIEYHRNLNAIILAQRSGNKALQEILSKRKEELEKLNESWEN
jgi:CRISPR/Cas system CMR-associated protein Cmr3 (group 5 of RAMP superfamily)